MSKLLNQLADIDVELGLNELHDRPYEEAVEYVETQIKEIRAIMWRLRVDLILNNAIEAQGDSQVEEQAAKTRTIKNDLRQMGRAVTTLNDLLNELKKQPAK